MFTVSILITFLLFVTVNSDDNGELCKSGGCHDKRPFMEFPGNEEELNEYCITLTDYFSCLAEYLTTCHPEEYEDASRFNSMLEVLSNICDKNTEIYKALAQHIGCIKDTLMNFNVTCGEMAKEISTSNGFPDTEEEEEYIKYDCFRQALEGACIAWKIGESCDVAGEKAFVDVFSELKKTSAFCKGAVLEKVAKYSEGFEMAEEIRNRLLYITLLDQQ